MERLYGIVVFSLGLAILWEGRSLSFGTFRNPGSGMFPDLIAILMLVLSATLIAKPPKKESRESPISGKTVVLIWLAFASLVLYAIFLDFLGFLIASFLLSVFLFGVFDSGAKYYMAVFKALALTGLAYVLFETVLKSNLPKGLLSF